MYCTLNCRSSSVVAASLLAGVLVFVGIFGPSEVEKDGTYAPRSAHSSENIHSHNSSTLKLSPRADAERLQQGPSPFRQPNSTRTKTKQPASIKEELMSSGRRSGRRERRTTTRTATVTTFSNHSLISSPTYTVSRSASKSPTLPLKRQDRMWGFLTLPEDSPLLSPQ